MKKITPFRQIAALYGAILEMSLTSKETARQITDLNNTILDISLSSRESANALKLIEENINILAEAAVRAYPPAPTIHPSIYEIDSLKLLLDTTSLVDRMVVETGAWEREQVQYLCKIAEKFRGENNPVFLDLGSYWGYYSLMLSKTGIFHKIYAFEADPFNYSQLCSNIFLNKLDQLITPKNLAVSDSSGTLNMGISKNIQDGNRGANKILDDAADINRNSQIVDSIALDKFLHLKDSAILIKMDIEAHEDRALLGMKGLIENNKVILQIEIYAEQRTQVTPILESFGLRMIHEIYPDFYYTNFSG
jgi:FkbM family methyltransferase